MEDIREAGRLEIMVDDASCMLFEAADILVHAVRACESTILDLRGRTGVNVREHGGQSDIRRKRHQ